MRFFHTRMDWLQAAQIPITIIVLWIFTVWMSRAFPTLQNKRICLVIAHPDDEAMFFAPMIRSLMRPELGNQLVIMCFSSGDADGLGHIRKEELAKSAVLLGLRSSEHVVVIEDTKNFPDSMTTNWDAKLVAQMLAKYFSPNLAKTPLGEAPESTIDVIITFDQGGVSGHPNHISLHHGAVAFLRNLMHGRAGWDCPVKLYTLTTTNVLRKYSSILDSLATVIGSLLSTKERGSFPTPLLAVSSPSDMRIAQRAMTTAHKSQMRWFRWAWIGISRYMVVNDLKKQKGF